MNTKNIQTENDDIQEISTKSNYTNDILIISLGLLYSYLFYDQGIGINYLFFSILLPMVLLWRDKLLIQSKSFIVLSLTTILSGWLCFYFGTSYHLWMHKISILILAGISFSSKTSMIVAFYQSIYSVILSPIFILTGMIDLNNRPIGRFSALVKYALLSIIPIVLALIFLFLYTASNPILAKFLSTISWDFISISFLFFIVYSFIFVFGLLKQRKIDFLNKYDISKSDNLTVENDVLYKSILNFFSLKSEIYIASAVFILLNLVIALNNSLDIYYLFVKQVLPTDLSYTQFLHQGVNTLILSIFMAIGLIMYFFSSRLNFIKNAKYVKLIAYVWIFQNGVLVYLCLYKNIQYISQFGLTYKRIGVYTFLSLAFIGLAFTAFKILKNKTNFFLIRKNSWALYLVLMALGCYDWDYEITRHNLSVKTDKNIDYDYLLSLDHSGLPLLKKNMIKDNIEYNQTRVEVDSLLLEYEDRYLQDPKQRLIQKIENLKKDDSSFGIQSYCISRKNVLTQLNK